MALARQCTQAKSQDWVTSQITSSGDSLKSIFVRLRQGRSTPPAMYCRMVGSLKIETQTIAMNLSDKFNLERGRVYLTGIQALVRLPIDQMRRDRRAGLNTGTFISGYEGSPLGGYDLQLARSSKLLSEHNIVFQPGVNEDLAATSVMGSQIFEVVGKAKVDGVVGIWYGKGPGVDRSGDIFRHANLAGTGKNCAALVLRSEEHSCKSSTIPHQSDF